MNKNKDKKGKKKCTKENYVWMYIVGGTMEFEEFTSLAKAKEAIIEYLNNGIGEVCFKNGHDILIKGTIADVEIMQKAFDIKIK